MNVFTMMADGYRKHGKEKKAQLYDFLGTCSTEDIYTLFDSSAFNEIAQSYMSLAVRELVDEGELEEEQGLAIRNRFSLLFNEKRANEVCERP